MSDSSIRNADRLGADVHYTMMIKTLLWGAALFLASLGWLLPPSNTHYTFQYSVEIKSGEQVQVKQIIRSIDMISASGQVAPEDISVGKEVVDQSKGKGVTLLIGATFVTVIWAALALKLNLSRSDGAQSLFPSQKAVPWVIMCGAFAYMWFILNIVDVLPVWLGGQG